MLGTLGHHASASVFKGVPAAGHMKLDVKQEPNTLYWMILLENAKIFTWTGHYECKKNVKTIIEQMHQCGEKKGKSLAYSMLCQVFKHIFSPKRSSMF